MPEGPSIVILKEAMQKFNGKKVLEASGNAKMDKSVLLNKKVEFKSWGKHTLLCFPTFTVRIHLLMFGSYSVDEQIRPDKSLRLKLRFSNGTAYFYTCQVKLLADIVDNIYDWSSDVMNDHWSNAKAIKKLKAIPEANISDALLDQDIFAGVGNIIKNEILYISKIHPESVVGKIPPRKLTQLVKEARTYSFDFLKWKKAFELKKHWLAYTKKTCKRCDLPFIKKYIGKGKRRTFFCDNCQVLYI
jgi:endonuclease-8